MNKQLTQAQAFAMMLASAGIQFFPHDLDTDAFQNPSCAYMPHADVVFGVTAKNDPLFKEK
jgi:ornithine cyclodeaminase/alanine dehydrogenase-like protein (mu-crystallin family)